jgi:hypothetical protein
MPGMLPAWCAGRAPRTTRKVGAGEATALQGGQAKNAFLAVADGDTAKTGFIGVLFAAYLGFHGELQNGWEA